MGYPGEAYEVLRRKVLDGSAGRNNLSLVASNAKTDIVEAGLERGENKLTSREPTSDNSVVKEKGIEIQIARKTRFGQPSRTGDAWVNTQGKHRGTERVPLLDPPLAVNQRVRVPNDKVGVITIAGVCPRRQPRKMGPHG